MVFNDNNNLPQSDLLNISALTRLFKNTTNSYKYQFFLSILDILIRKRFDVSEPIELREVIIEMLANAWYPHNYFRLSFGIQDKIADKLDALNLQFSNFKDPDKKELREAISSRNLDDVIFYIRRYVPFRLITPFLETELKGIDRNYEVDTVVTNISRIYFQSRKPLYCFDSSEYRECRAIIIHPDWGRYIEANYSILRGWVSWEWLKYMQRCNPNTPAIASKLFPPLQRESLANQTKYWILVLEHTEIKCIYSNLFVSKDDLSLDHYLPWSFVAHDQLWNLIPTPRAINSTKSNNIPVTDKYFDKFVQLQYLGLTTSYTRMTEKQWSKYVESYLSDLKIAHQSSLLDLNLLREAYKSTIIPLISLASNQGFKTDWSYK